MPVNELNSFTHLSALYWYSMTTAFQVVEQFTSPLRIINSDLDVYSHVAIAHRAYIFATHDETI
jgi:hypothetical protein